MKAVLSALSVGIALMVMGTSASAVPFSYRFESTVADGTSGFPASPGDPASITVTLDNGGTSDLSQVWTREHLQSVVFDINNGAATASFFSPFDGGIFFDPTVPDPGSFATDAAGNLISVPLGEISWQDRFVTADFAASFPFDNDLNWFFIGRNPVLIDDFGGARTLRLNLADVAGIVDPASWSRVTALPLPPTLLLLLVGLGGVALLRRAGPGTAGGLAEAKGA